MDESIRKISLLVTNLTLMKKEEMGQRLVYLVIMYLAMMEKFVKFVFTEKIKKLFLLFIFEKIREIDFIETYILMHMR